MIKTLTGYLFLSCFLFSIISMNGCTVDFMGTACDDVPIDDSLPGCYFVEGVAVLPGDSYDTEIFIQIIADERCPNTVSGYGFGVIGAYTFTGAITEPGHAVLEGNLGGDWATTEHIRIEVDRPAGRDILLTYTGHRIGGSGDWQSFPREVSLPFTLYSTPCPPAE